jgi:hypothetical protein
MNDRTQEEQIDAIQKLTEEAEKLSKDMAHKTLSPTEQPPKEPLSKKQQKARAKAKQQRKSRRKNRKKR